ncbi:hypothetical protein EJ08DRAFT_683890 [Tothia fuscella]|uniref:Uncharacterized protein n=1 Tax=Tothia fuscella TaxID=1048955 RepID=A0A9P4TSI1_9PEZI|nr:hypothetical protein EJ08DRAFT_683890 [Tothia fuscella]
MKFTLSLIAAAGTLFSTFAAASAFTTAVAPLHTSIKKIAMPLGKRQSCQDSCLLDVKSCAYSWGLHRFCNDKYDGCWTQSCSHKGFSDCANCPEFSCEGHVKTDDEVAADIEAHKGCTFTDDFATEMYKISQVE